MKKLIILLAFLALFGITSCKNKDSNTKVDTPSDTTNNLEKKSNSLVVYFSATNNTEKVATTISEHINASLYKLEPVNAYTSRDLNYSNSLSRVVSEYNQRQRFRNGEIDDDVHIELKNVNFIGFDNAEYIFLGAPVWWRELSWVIDDFITLNNFSGKTIIPFGTSSSSTFTIDHLKSLNNTGVWQEPHRFSSSASTTTINTWIDSLGYTF